MVVVVVYCWKSETRNWEKFWKSGHHHPQDDQGVTFGRKSLIFKLDLKKRHKFSNDGAEPCNT